MLLFKGQSSLGCLGYTEKHKNVHTGILSHDHIPLYSSLFSRKEGRVETKICMFIVYPTKKSAMSAVVVFF